MIKRDGKIGSDWIEKWEAKTGERRKIKLPRSGFVHLANLPAPGTGASLQISRCHLRFGQGLDRGQTD